tara:strand:+ start:11941 stop:12504 length:564 start_codon:yes stop_codon:yes gene_type:complete
MLIHKSHSKTDLIELINLLELPIVFSHQDNKKDIQDKLNDLLNENFKIKDNYYNIENKTLLKTYLSEHNPKKILTTKEKNNVMNIAKYIIQYTKSNYCLENSKYNSYQEIQDDMDYIKQFGDIPSVRRCCRLLNLDINFANIVFKPLISPQVQLELEEKKLQKIIKYDYKLIIRHSTPENPIILYFD